jgi:hypothetical protein
LTWISVQVVKESKATTNKTTYSIGNGRAIKAAPANPGLGKSATESTSPADQKESTAKSFRLLYILVCMYMMMTYYFTSTLQLLHQLLIHIPSFNS